MQLDHILASASSAGYVNETVKGVRQVGDAIAGLAKIFKDTHGIEADGDETVDDLRARHQHRVLGDRNRSVPVRLDPGTDAVLSEAGNEESWPFGGTSPMRRVELRLSEDDNVIVFLADRMVGGLSEEDASEFVPLFRTESKVDHTISVAGWRYQRPDGHWELWLQQPDFFWKNTLDPFFCIVCGKLVSNDYTKNPDVWLSRRTDVGKEGRSVTAHLSCMEEGKALAAAEGITRERRS